MNDTTFENDLRAALAARTDYEVPAALYASVKSLSAATESARGFRLRLGRFPSMAAALVGVTLVVTLLGVVVMGYAGSSFPGAGAGGQRNFEWQTQVASLAADSVTISTNGHVFRPPKDAQLHSDPGTPTYRTLEMEWHEQGVEQRLYIYFAADDTNWWVNEMRTRDGADPAEWLYFPHTTQIGAPLGESFIGDINLSADNANAQLRMTNARLTAFTPGTGINYAPGCEMVGPAPDPNGGPVSDHFNPDVPHVALQAGMSAKDADARLNAAGTCHEFRFEYPASNHGQIWCSAPPGNVREWVYGDMGQLILFVEAGPAETLSPDAPLMVGCG